MGREILCVEATPTRPRSSSNNCRDLGVKRQSLYRAWSFRRTAAPAGRWLYLGTNCLARRFTSSVVKTRPGEDEFFMRALYCFERIFYPKTTRPELFGEWGSGGSLVRPWRPQSVLGVTACNVVASNPGRTSTLRPRPNTTSIALAFGTAFSSNSTATSRGVCLAPCLPPSRCRRSVPSDKPLERQKSERFITGASWPPFLADLNSSIPILSQIAISFGRCG
jgi:hypothetical protein